MKRMVWTMLIVSGGLLATAHFVLAGHDQYWTRQAIAHLQAAEQHLWYGHYDAALGQMELAKRIVEENGYGNQCGGCGAFGCYYKGGGCNSFGCWRAGGGCSSFGCWQRGGGCNSFGCWREGGSCNSFGCVKSWHGRSEPCR